MNKDKNCKNCKHLNYTKKWKNYIIPSVEYWCDFNNKILNLNNAENCKNYENKYNWWMKKESCDSCKYRTLNDGSYYCSKLGERLIFTWDYEAELCGTYEEVIPMYKEQIDELKEEINIVEKLIQEKDKTNTNEDTERIIRALTHYLDILKYDLKEEQFETQSWKTRADIETTF